MPNLLRFNVALFKSRKASTMERKKTKQSLFKVTETDPDKMTIFAKVVGGICLLQFIIIWLLSASSPFVFGIAIYHESYRLALGIVLVTAIAYSPWKKGIIANSLQQVYAYYSHRYMRKTTIICEGSKPNPKGDKQTFFAVHPHGAFCIGWAFLYCHDMMQHIRFCFSPVLFMSPFFRLFSRGVGNPGSASKDSMITYMRKGESLALPPGGFEEATLTSTKHDRVFIKKRTGFVRLCLRHGIAIRPIYVFGEKSCYWNIQGAFKSRLTLNRYGIPTIFAWGNPLIPWLPKPHAEVHIVIGKPIELPRIEKPTKEEVAAWHAKYVAALTQLFEDHKQAAYGPNSKTMKLEVW